MICGGQDQYDKLAQLEKNCTTAKQNVQLQKNDTTAKLYVGIIQIQEINRTAKKMAQLRNKMSTAKQSTTAKHIYCSCTFFGNT
jgi:hypothetical protein